MIHAADFASWDQGGFTIVCSCFDAEVTESGSWSVGAFRGATEVEAINSFLEHVELVTA